MVSASSDPSQNRFTVRSWGNLVQLFRSFYRNHAALRPDLFGSKQEPARWSWPGTQLGDAALSCVKGPEN